MFSKVFLAVSLFVSASAFADETFNGVHADNFSQQQLASQPVTVKGNATMRVLHFEVKPGGTLSAHRHTGQGFMCVTAGELSGSLNNSNLLLRAGSCMYDSGSAVHSVKNTGSVDVVGYTFEVLPTPALQSRTARSAPSGMDSLLPPK